MRFIRMAVAAAVAIAVFRVFPGNPQAGAEPVPKAVVEADPDVLELVRRAATSAGRTPEQWEQARFAGLRAMRSMPPDKVLPQIVSFVAKEARKPGAGELTEIGALLLFKVL